jgi:DNA-binding CsgD family transcriptional regulator
MGPQALALKFFVPAPGPLHEWLERGFVGVKQKSLITRLGGPQAVGRHDALSSWVGGACEEYVNKSQDRGVRFTACTERRYLRLLKRHIADFGCVFCQEHTMYEESCLVDTTHPSAMPAGQGALRYVGPERRAGGSAVRSANRSMFDVTPRNSPLSPHLLALMLDEVDYGMLLLNAKTEVVHANHAARSDMDSNHPLLQESRHLRARSTPDNNALSRALLAARRERRRCLLTLGADEKRLMVAVIPLGPVTAPAFLPSAGEPTDEAAVLLVFGKRQVCETLSVQWFAQQHRLTLAEAQVLRALCGGAAPGEVAAVQGVAVSTVRSQLSSIRAKTGANSLRELVRQVAVLPPLLGALRQS